MLLLFCNLIPTVRQDISAVASSSRVSDANTLTLALFRQCQTLLLFRQYKPLPVRWSAGEKSQCFHPPTFTRTLAVTSAAWKSLPPRRYVVDPFFDGGAETAS